MAKETRELEQRYQIEASPKKVFKALTSPKKLVKWMLSEAEIEPAAGSRYTFVWPGGYRHTGEVLSVEEGRRLVLSWPHGPKRSVETTRVSFDLRPRREGTLLSLAHTGFGDGEEWVRRFALTSSGWAYYLTNLKSVLENGHDLRRAEDEF